MTVYPYQVLAPRLSRAPTIIAIAIVVVSNLIGSSISAAVSSIPPGYSSEIIQVKFREGTDVRQPEILLPYSVSNVIQLFSLPREKLNQIKDKGKSLSKKKLPDLNLWFQITLSPGTNAAKFIDQLRRLESVEIAEPAPLPHPMPAITPNFTGNQGYLNAATDGIDARFSWTIPGGNGSEIKIYDVEYSWNQAHEDLSKVSGVSLLLNPGDSIVDPFNNNNHGTAVLGELIADNDTKGVTGISWGADIGLAPANTASLGYNPANAILLAVANGSAGDVILIEQQFPVCGLDYGPLETITSVFEAIQTAVANQFVVVEAAGNGGVNLDQAACGTTFDRTVRDSGAIIVGAGGSPGSGLDRQRLSFSSYGSRIDVQGWGDGVATAGYGSLYANPDDPTNSNFWYTGTFSGTSSASPIVAGAVANLQSIVLKQFGTPLAPLQVRQSLVETGSPQLGDTTEHIGPRPNLRQAIEAATKVITVSIDIKPGSFPNAINPKNEDVIPVAILTTNTFDATTVDPLTVEFGPNGAMEAHRRGHIEDADGDGDLDLVLHFLTQDTGIMCGATSVSLTGKTFNEQTINGTDQIKTVGCQ